MNLDRGRMSRMGTRVVNGGFGANGIILSSDPVPAGQRWLLESIAGYVFIADATGTSAAGAVQGIFLCPANTNVNVAFLGAFGSGIALPEDTASFVFTGLNNPSAGASRVARFVPPSLSGLTMPEGFFLCLSFPHSGTNYAAGSTGTLIFSYVVEDACSA